MEHKRNMLNFILLGVIVFLLFLLSNKQIKHDQSNTITKIDTVYKKVSDTVIKNVKVKEFVYVYPEGDKYKPSNSIDTCKTRFDYLLKEFSAKKTYVDTLKIDTIGTVVIYDTVWKNELGNRKYLLDYNIPYITKTITKTEEPKRQLYIGANVLFNNNTVTPFSPGFIYKNKKDQIFQASIGLNFNGTITYGVGTYWKIKIK